MEKGNAVNAGKNDILESLPVLPFGGYDACHKCVDADYDTQRGEDDDFCCMICHNPNYPEHEKHKE